MFKQLNRLGFIIICGLSIPLIGVSYLFWGVSSTLILAGGFIYCTIEYIFTGNIQSINRTIKFVTHDYYMIFDTTIENFIELLYTDNNDN